MAGKTIPKSHRLKQNLLQQESEISLGVDRNGEFKGHPPPVQTLDISLSYSELDNKTLLLKILCTVAT